VVLLLDDSFRDDNLVDKLFNEVEDERGVRSESLTTATGGGGGTTAAAACVTTGVAAGLTLGFLCRNPEPRASIKSNDSETTFFSLTLGSTTTGVNTGAGGGTSGGTSGGTGGADCFLVATFESFPVT
jgi:hypothetical protein